MKLPTVIFFALIALARAQQANADENCTIQIVTGSSSRCFSNQQGIENAGQNVVTPPRQPPPRQSENIGTSVGLTPRVEQQLTHDRAARADILKMARQGSPNNRASRAAAALRAMGGTVSQNTSMSPEEQQAYSQESRADIMKAAQEASAMSPKNSSLIAAAAIDAMAAVGGDSKQSPPPANQGVPRSAINTRTGEVYPGVAGGVINPKTGQFYPEVAGGYINPATGQIMPKQ